MTEKTKKSENFMYVLEGIDNAGKSTIIDQLVKNDIFSEDDNINLIVNAEPGATEFGQAIRELVKFNKDLTPEVRCSLFTAAMLQKTKVIKEQMIPGKKNVVITDRWVCSNVYQLADLGYGDLAIMNGETKDTHEAKSGMSFLRHCERVVNANMSSFSTRTFLIKRDKKEQDFLDTKDAFESRMEKSFRGDKTYREVVMGIYEEEAASRHWEVVNNNRPLNESVDHIISIMKMDLLN